MMVWTAEGVDWLGRLLILKEAAGILLSGLAWLGGIGVFFGMGWRRLKAVSWPNRRRRALRHLRDVRRFHANPRLLVADVARRIVGLGIVGASILLNRAMYAGDHIRALSGRPMPALRWELAMDALTITTFVILLIVGGAQTVERIEQWANVSKARRRYFERHGRRIPSRKDSR